MWGSCGRMLWGCQSFLHWRTSLVSFTQSLLEPGSAGPPGEAQHSDPGLQQLHVSCQVPLHAKCHHGVHQQEQDQQPACFCGGDLEKVPQHQVSFFSLTEASVLLLLPHVFLSNRRILSMMNNEAAPSYFNGGSLTQYTDYRWACSFLLTGAVEQLHSVETSYYQYELHTNMCSTQHNDLCPSVTTTRCLYKHYMQNLVMLSVVYSAPIWFISATTQGQDVLC